MLTVTLPFPPAELSPNRKNGRHWGQTHAAKTAYRDECWALSLKASRGYLPPAGDIALRVTFVQPDKRRRDRDNLLAASKAALDGFAAALKVDDSRFEPVTVSRVFGAKPGALILEIASDAAALSAATTRRRTVMTMSGSEILALPMAKNDADAKTIKEYLLKLLTGVIVEEEGFSGKRPFGNSGWFFELEQALVSGKAVAGTIDEDGCVECDGSAAQQAILSAIRAL